MHIVRFQDGKAIEHWGVRDDSGMMRQLGVIAEPDRAKETSPT
jgi:predicted SnoaL-like aldol condensation-catalyzing enzyme